MYIHCLNHSKTRKQAGKKVVHSINRAVCKEEFVMSKQAGELRIYTKHKINPVSLMDKLK